MSQVYEPTNIPENIKLKDFIYKLLLKSILPIIIICTIVALRITYSWILARYFSGDIYKEIDARIAGSLQLIIMGCVYWFIIRGMNLLNKYGKQYLNRQGHAISGLTLSFLISSLKIILLLSFIILFVDFLPISTELSYLAEKIMSIFIIMTITWILIRLVNLIEQLIFLRYQVIKAEDIFAQKVHTQLILLKRIFIGVIIVLALGAILMQFTNVRELGTSILASAGIATVIVGLAVQKLLSVLIIGLQVALNQPIKINDYVIIENEFGQIEEITLYYVVVRIWDLRKLILPINYFIEKPFQNLSRNNKFLLGTAFFYVDYSVPVKKLVEKLQEIVRNSSLWDKQLCQLQVTDCKESTIELRALVSARSPNDLWNLRCEVREKLLEYIHQAFPMALPHTRLSVMQKN